MTRTLPTGSSSIGRTTGYSLVEVLTVLTIVSILVASISFIVVKRPPGLKDSAVEIYQQLHFARQRAMRDQQPYQVFINLAENKIHLVDKIVELPGEIAITVRTAEEQLIDSESVGMTFYPDASSSGGTIVLESESEMFQLSVNWITGKISLRNRDVAG